jgi:hypothetical protein
MPPSTTMGRSSRAIVRRGAPVPAGDVELALDPVLLARRAGIEPD